MFCYQCEQTAKGNGCTSFGVCGKDPETSSLQDLLLESSKGVSMWAHRANRMGAETLAADKFIIEALFTTVTNVNFDARRIAEIIVKAASVRDETRKIYEETCRKNSIEPETLSGEALFEPSPNFDELVRLGEEASIEKRVHSYGNTAVGLMELIVYGLKGMAAYADHALILGVTDAGVFRFFHEALDFLTQPRRVEELLTMALRVGEVNLKVMELLDRANTTAYGNPKPTQVRVTPVKGKAILVSGHDLKDLEELLKQSEGKGINIYTHGEMLPAHGYPELKKYKHLVGNYGGAWQDQQKEFDAFPGAILMTTNCIQKPKESYKARIFTSGLVAWPGVEHISDRNFKPVIEAALEAPGFLEDAPEQNITVGFGHNTVLGIADKVVEAVKKGDIKRFFLIGGCDGAKSGRNYYTEFAMEAPKDTVILTLACGKYRFNKLEFGDIGGIPRLLDVGQCNDAYSAIKIASALAQAFGTDVNGIPLSFVLSWYEQKAVCILLTLLHLGIKNIRIGPSLPAFLTPDALGVLVDKFGLKPIGTVSEDLKAAMSGN